MSKSARRPVIDAPQSWLLVLCLVGLDYFSTLAYLPSIAVEAAGALAPLAALAISLVTLALVIPVYWYVVGRSSQGRGATGLLERIIRGWRGKLVVLTLLGFAAADFVLTRSLSIADAAIHLIHNPHGQELLNHLSPAADGFLNWLTPAVRARVEPFMTRQLLITLSLSLMTFGFWSMLKSGFTRKILYPAAFFVCCYLLLSGVVIGSGLAYLADQPAVVNHWLEQLARHGRPDGAPTWSIMVLVPLVLWTVPQMALGLSGFELTMTIAPRVRGLPDDDPECPRGRVRNTRKLMVAAALIMTVYLCGAVLVTALLVPPSAVGAGGGAQHRALAYLAHGGSLADGRSAAALNPLFGEAFGSLLDVSTVLILSLAGASVMSGLRTLLPHYLHRLGMEISWAGRVGVMMQLLNAITLLVTVVFRASLSSQQWAYATSVLVLVSGASLAAVWDLKQQMSPARLWLWAVAPFGLACVFFFSLTALTVYINRSGLVIAMVFVLTIIAGSFVSRWIRSTELRFEGFAYADEASRARWREICAMEFQVLVPHRPGRMPLSATDQRVRREYRLDPIMPVVFVEATLGDPSDFYHAPLMSIEREDGLEVIRVSHCVSVPHVLAAICVELCKVGHPPEIIFGWSNETPLAANVSFLLLGEGNIPWMVRELVRKALADPTRLPRIRIG